MTTFIPVLICALTVTQPGESPVAETTAAEGANAETPTTDKPVAETPAVEGTNVGPPANDTAVPREPSAETPTAGEPTVDVRNEPAQKEQLVSP